jgi:hypothetical protein
MSIVLSTLLVRLFNVQLTRQRRNSDHQGVKKTILKVKLPPAVGQHQRTYTCGALLFVIIFYSRLSYN